MEHLLQVKNLSTYFFTEAGVVKAVEEVSIHVDRGETIALVGESGCGKTVCSLSIMRLIRMPGRIVSGEVWLGGTDLLPLQERQMRKIRGAKIGMVFQEPMLSFDPVQTVGAQIMEPLAHHKKLGYKEAFRKTVELLNMVGITDADRRVYSYPHEFSGGMLQRAMIALAISCEPQVLIADEPTTSLDVTIQAQVLELLGTLSQTLGTATVLITHNFGIVSRYAKRAYVMYAGNIVEAASVLNLYQQPLHPYTRALWASVLTLDRPQKSRLLLPAGWRVPDLSKRAKGCAYFPHCKDREPECEENQPALIHAGDSHYVRCYRAAAGDKNATKQ